MLRLSIQNDDSVSFSALHFVSSLAPSLAPLCSLAVLFLCSCCALALARTVLLLLSALLLPPLILSQNLLTPHSLNISLHASFSLTFYLLSNRCFVFYMYSLCTLSVLLYLLAAWLCNCRPIIKYVKPPQTFASKTLQCAKTAAGCRMALECLF
jgi:hypothetical protein